MTPATALCTLRAMLDSTESQIIQKSRSGGTQEMFYGLGVLEWLLLGSGVVGAVSTILGLVILLLFWWRPVVPTAPGQGVRVKLPGGFEVSVGTVAATPFVLGLLFLAGMIFAAYHFSPSMFPIKGTVKLTSTRSIAGIVVGVLPSNHLTQTQSDGTFSMLVPKQSTKGISYQTIVYLPTANPPQFYVGVVGFNADGEGRFDHTLTGGR